ncbi:uncharacterized protein LOC121860108 [Homarus americanus]|uniref:uncharacterized protein LOC121860108 n=1 Tax=Homarus americanus TaxID=6706 RepID=UPI001C46D5F5|nr:uncharacterized protein LOC121860108 [Homarus americanus]
MADIFSREDAKSLLKKKVVLMMGDSNMRAFYKDLIRLLVEGDITPSQAFRRGGPKRASHCGDEVLDISQNDRAGRDYVETRQYKDDDTLVRFHFLTRVYSSVVKKELTAIEDGSIPIPHVVIVNSCLWDITRWGAMQEDQYKEDMVRLFQHLRRLLPDDTLIIWTTTLPVSTEKIKGGVFIKQIQFMKHSMRFIILEANKFAQQLCMSFEIDLLDLHYHMRFQLHWRASDGLHWEPVAVRHMVNLILTHTALCWDKPLPGNFTGTYVQDAERRIKEESLEEKGEIKLDQKIHEFLQKKSQEEGPKKQSRTSLGDSVNSQQQVKKQSTRVPVRAPCYETEDKKKPSTVNKKKLFRVKNKKKTWRANFSGGSHPQQMNLFGSSHPQQMNFSGGSHPQQMNFSGGSHPQQMNFSGSSHPQQMNFSGSSHPQQMNFSGSSHPQQMNFSGGSHPQQMNFSGSSHPQQMNFSGGSHPQPVNFSQHNMNRITQVQDATIQNFNPWVSNSSTSFRQSLNACAGDDQNAMFHGAPRRSDFRSRTHNYQFPSQQTSRTHDYHMNTYSSFPLPCNVHEEASTSPWSHQHSNEHTAYPFWQDYPVSDFPWNN